MRRNKRLSLFLAASLVLLLTVFVGHAHKERNLTASPAKSFTLLVDSVDYRSDLTRMYGRLVGRPHTSQRIDRIELSASGRRFDAEDIDGVDFARWFQWEDNGIIDIEVDFKSMPPVNSGILYVTTPRGIEEISFSTKSK